MNQLWQRQRDALFAVFVPVVGQLVRSSGEWRLAMDWRCCEGRHLLIGCAMAAILGSLMPSIAASQTPVGHWQAVFTGPINERPKPLWKVVFSIAYSPTGLIVNAKGVGWPSVLHVTDVSNDGNRLHFVGTGNEGSTMCMGGVCKTSCCPTLTFDGTIDGDRMTLTLRWGSTNNPNEGRPLPMEATRLWADAGRDDALRTVVHDFLGSRTTPAQLEASLRAYLHAFDGHPYRVSVAPLDASSFPQERWNALLVVCERIADPEVDGLMRREIKPVVAARRVAPLVLMFGEYLLKPPPGADEFQRARFEELAEDVHDFAAEP
jgi:hypothetical protein